MWLAKDFLPKLSDLGLVKPIHLNANRITPQSNECILKSTWHYFAPETFDNHIYSEATDVYSSKCQFEDLNLFQSGEKVTQDIWSDFPDKQIGKANRNVWLKNAGCTSQTNAHHINSSSP